MQKNNQKILFSASDIANFLECEHLTYLDRLNLDQPMQKTADGEDTVLIQNKGLKHEKNYLSQLKNQHSMVVDIVERVGKSASNEDKAVETLKAMQEGADIIYQATFIDDNLLGHADFLRKINQPSNLGNYSYEVIDTKLSGKTQAKFIIQLIFYSKLLSNIQGVYPRAMYVVLGTNEEKKYYCTDYAAYFDQLLSRFRTHVASQESDTYPTPCKKCDLCHWRERCEQQRIDDDHLSQVAGINKSQISKLKEAGITTMAALAALSEQQEIPKLNALSLNKIRHQAYLQDHFRQTGNARVDLLPTDNAIKRGFLRLPEPNIGDLYFDMEGNPLEDVRHLEYLFGLYYLKDNKPIFKAFWALDHSKEKKAFEDFMDFVTTHLEKYPKAHIYHYASYEESALKRLMSFYGTREQAVDQLLRDGRLVDLYKVVRESMQTSEPKYSIKNIEHFYLEKRQGEVTNAGASIIYFENWKATKDQKYLDDIAAYNEDDVRSTLELHRWLISLRPKHLPWANPEAIKYEESLDNESQETPASILRERELARYKVELLGQVDIPEEEKSAEYKTNELVFQLMDFHRREAKPAWWDFYARKEKNVEELLEDPETIANLVPHPQYPTEDVKRSKKYYFTYPPQETKLHSGSKPIILESEKGVSNFTVEPNERLVSFTLGNKTELPENLHLGPNKPIESKVLIQAIQRFVDDKIAGNHQYRAIEELLSRSFPNIEGKQQGAPILTQARNIIEEAIDAISHLDQSYLVIQGPPGTGKTYSGSKVIVELLKQGKRIGITSNSHKAINNLLKGIDGEVVSAGFTFQGIKKSTGSDEDLIGCVNITIADDNETALNGDFNLVAGTAWLFAREDADQFLDYLFIDEAGQVSLGNLIAMGTSTKNIILMGDQMQLGQPIQGTHPGDSGLSALEFILQDHHTVPENRGIFLGVSYRMHPKVCQFISNTVYDGRLKSDASTENQKIICNKTHPYIKPNGIVYVPIDHQNCTQSSDEEAQLIKTLIEDLCEQSYQDKDGLEHPISLNEILVVTPYNLQVQKLSVLLPEGAKIGTVDKFQGQEAPVVIFSMVTSSGDDLPRDIEFLFSKNRLNVAISRAQALMIFIANPKLMTIQCNKPEEMALVNTLCLLNQYRVSKKN